MPPIAAGICPMLFFGFYAEDAYLQQLFAHEAAPQVSAIKFQKPLLQGLSENGCQVTLLAGVPIAPFPRNPKLVTGHAALAPFAGITGWRMPCLNLPGIRMVSRLITGLAYGAVALVRRRHRVIVVYSLHSPFLLAALILKTVFGCKLWVFIPDLPMHMSSTRMGSLRAALKRVDSALLHQLIRGADGCFPVTRAIANDWLPARMPQQVIEGIAPVRPSTAPLLPRAVRPRILYAGSFTQTAHFVKLFAATPALDAELVLIGSGEDKAAMQDAAAGDARITIKDFLLGDALEQEFAAADYFLNPRDGYWEGAQYSFPSKLFDYMARGKPILSTRLPGVPESYYACFFAIENTDPAAFEASMKNALAATADELSRRIETGFALLAERSPKAVGALVLREVAR